MISTTQSNIANKIYASGLFLTLLLCNSNLYSKDLAPINLENHNNVITKISLNTTIIAESQKKENKVQYTYNLTQFFKNENKPYINDGVRFISSKDNFVDLAVNLNETAAFIKKIGEIYETVFYNEINDLTKDNKLITIKVLIFNYDKNTICENNCYNMKITFHSADKFGPEISEFSKKVRNLPPIKVDNIKSKSVAEFQIYLNTKNKDFITLQRFNKEPLISISPYYNRG